MIDIKEKTDEQLQESKEAVDDQHHLVEELENKVVQLKDELQQTQDTLKQKMEAVDDQRKLALDLERERGRLAGKQLNFIITYHLKIIREYPEIIT